MAKVRSNSTSPVTVYGKDRSAQSVAPGETKEVPFDKDNMWNNALVKQGAISVEGVEASSAENTRPRRASGARKSAKQTSRRGRSAKEATEAPLSQPPKSVPTENGPD